MLKQLLYLKCLTYYYKKFLFLDTIIDKQNMMKIALFVYF